MFVLAVTLGAILALGACAKKKAPPPPPPPPAPPAPTASLSVNPSSIQTGQSASLTWQTTNATDVSIDGIGAVQANGSQPVTPTDSTTYHLTAKGAGGSQEATARITVAQPPPPPAPAAATPPDEDLFSQNIKDVYFDYDQAEIRGDQQSSVLGDVQFLNQHAAINFTVEGHCDERGSTEYNLALGDKRATAVKNALVAAGVGASRIKTISYGAIGERPLSRCPGSEIKLRNEIHGWPCRAKKATGSCALLPVHIRFPLGLFSCGILATCGILNSSKTGLATTGLSRFVFNFVFRIQGILYEKKYETKPCCDSSCVDVGAVAGGSAGLGRQQGYGPIANPGRATATADDLDAAQL